ncbi:hypothetical protein EM595_p0229 (plasmid) [Duffyella gerundensis]|uniref:Uncharacterized protein n=1 Tax=Duffyella gerundensis TaxID=1619313 RepID=A0A0U5L542_9GAMM|nr:hypothetical protein EM595_p0229 [Duffyella gerundensis]
MKRINPLSAGQIIIHRHSLRFNACAAVMLLGC